MALELIIASKLPEGVHEKVLNEAVVQVDQLVPEAPTGRINLKLVDDTTIRALNKNYSGHDKATDVLSFSYIEDGAAPVDEELGDIAISTVTATRQAEAAKTTLETELALLLTHGVLHVLGFDHAVEADLDKMESLQSQVMKQLGLTYRNFAWDLSEV